MAPADGSMPATSRTEMGGLTTRTAEMKHGNTAFHSTWHEMDKQKSWGLSQWMLHLLDIDLLPPYYEAPVHKKTGKMPIQLHPVAAFALYMFWFKIFGMMLLQMLRNVARMTGFLDGTHPHDGIPDESTGKVVASLMYTSTYCPMIAIMLAYDCTAPPHITFPWIMVYIGMYNITLDFYFYWYHCAMHEVPWLCKFHTTHHKTKHANPTLTLFADEVQEMFDIAIILLCAYLTMCIFTSLNFYEW